MTNLATEEDPFVFCLMTKLICKDSVNLTI